MDDFNISSLHESKNEWGARLLTIMTPLIIEGFRSIFEEACKLCRENNEEDKYLMTFQNFITRIPKWNPTIIEEERKRICDKSNCGYLEDLVTCVHIIQLKLLTAVRAGKKQKKIDINIPKLDDFIHKAYIHVARKIYKNVYLFELNIPPLQVQKNYRELEIIIQECTLNAIRESIPIDSILRAYMDETIEEDVVEEIKEQVIETPKPLPGSIPPASTPEPGPSSSSIKTVENVVSDTLPTLESNGVNMEGGFGSPKLSFNDVDLAIDTNNSEQQIVAPKTIDRLEKLSADRYEQRRLEEQEEDDSDNVVKLNISTEPAQLEGLDIYQPEDLETLPDLLSDIEVLE
jgi:hypothetical protein